MIRTISPRVRSALVVGLVVTGLVAGGAAASARSAGPETTPPPAHGGKLTRAQKPPAATRIEPQNLGSYQIVSRTAPIFPGEDAGVFVECPPGMRVLGGGGSTSPWNAVTVLTDSLPTSSTVWLAWIRNQGSITANLTTYAVCGS